MSRSYLDFKAIRERVPFLGVLDRYHIEVKRVNGSQLKGRCPLPSHTSKEPDTFCVNTDKNVFCCHSDSCKKSGRGASGNVIDFVCLMESIQAYEAAAKLNEWYPEGLPPKPITAAEPEENRPLAFTLKDVNPEHPEFARAFPIPKDEGHPIIKASSVCRFGCMMVITGGSG